MSQSSRCSASPIRDHELDDTKRSVNEAPAGPSLICIERPKAKKRAARSIGAADHRRGDVKAHNALSDVETHDFDVNDWNGRVPPMTSPHDEADRKGSRQDDPILISDDED